MIAGILGTKALWYLARGTGIVSLALLTAVMLLGITAHSGSGLHVPRFAVTLLHRNLSLLAVVFLLVHIATSVLDPFAAIAWSDAVMPLSASYRPLWLGLGALAFDLLLALAITSLVRVRLGLRTWRSIHWLAYACWPVALVHGLGTGSDARSPWLLGLVAASVLSVVVAACVRLATASSLDLPRRVAVGAVVLLGPLLLTGWLESGPLQPGWAGRAGTPAPLLRHTSSPTGGVSGTIGLPRAEREAGG